MTQVPARRFTIEPYLAFDGLFEFGCEYREGRTLPVEVPAHPDDPIRCNHRLRPRTGYYVYADLAIVAGDHELPIDFIDGSRDATSRWENIGVGFPPARADRGALFAKLSPAHTEVTAQELRQCEEYCASVAPE